MESHAKLNISLDYRLISIVLLVVIAAMLFAWRPWSAAKVGDRTIDVTGTATISARPDEFIFYPTYDFKNADKTVALEQMAAKSNEVVAGLKNLGVDDKDIKTNTDGWAYPTALRGEGDSNETTYTLRLTVTTNSEELTQKVQDYLVSTAPTGGVSPQATFSEVKRKELETKARDAAIKDARSKAEQSAKNLGFKLTDVKTVNDGSGFGVYPAYDTAMTMEARSSAGSSLSLQPGENELTYSVTVTYYIR